MLFCTCSLGVPTVLFGTSHVLSCPMVMRSTGIIDEEKLMAGMLIDVGKLVWVCAC